MTSPFKDCDMTCPHDIADIIAELLSEGLMRVRACARPGQEKRCFIEADHLHNLPHIINDFKVERLQYYWDVERPIFMKSVPPDETQDLAPLWDQLGELMRAHGIPQGERTRAVSQVG
jgi:hypothetical protein